jgi:predicted O-methyltransferase YrrM
MAGTRSPALRVNHEETLGFDPVATSDRLQAPSPDEVRRLLSLTESVDGWLTVDEASLLYSLARQATDGAIVEIGSWKGRSTIWMAHGTRAGARLPIYAVDPHSTVDQEQFNDDRSTFDDFKGNIAAAGVDDLIRPLVATSEDAARHFEEPIALLFIDADHSHAAVRADFINWRDKIRPGGAVCFHDVWKRSGPWQVIVEEIAHSGEYAGFGVAGSIFYARKRKPSSALERARDRSVLPIKALGEWAGRRSIPALLRRPLSAAKRALTS